MKGSYVVCAKDWFEEAYRFLGGGKKGSSVERREKGVHQLFRTIADLLLSQRNCDQSLRKSLVNAAICFIFISDK